MGVRQLGVCIDHQVEVKIEVKYLGGLRRRPLVTPRLLVPF